MEEEFSFKTYEDIIKKIDEYRKEYSSLSKRFDSIKISFFDPEKQTLKERKADLKRRLEELKAKFNELNSLIENLTTFDASILIPFVAEYLSKNTFERYLTCEAEEIVSCGRTYSHFFYYFICNVKDMLETMYFSGYNVDKVINYNEKQKFKNNFIELSKKSNYALMDADGLTTGFNTFPELEEACRRIINLKLSEPRIGDEECLERALCGLVCNDTTAKDTKPFNKTLVNGKKIKEMSLRDIFSSQRR